MQISNELRTMILWRKPGHTLEAPFYQSREVFDLDVEAIFGRHWIYAGVEPDIPEPGDYFTVPIGRASVFVVRDDDMSIRAFHNVCRHRGARLCDGNKGSVGNIVCPYHQWTYDLTGKLIHTEHMGDGFDRSQYSLKKVHVANVAGLLFICLANEPPADIEDMRREMEPYIAPHRVVDCKVAFEEDLIENGNWKLTMENNRECYHCKANHPELTVSLYEFGFGYQPSPENARRCRRSRILSRQSMRAGRAAASRRSSARPSNSRVTAYRIERLPLDKAGKSQTMNSKVACQKLLGNLQQRNLGGLSFWTQPNSWHHFMSDHIVTFSVLPIDPEHTLLRTTWLVHQGRGRGARLRPQGTEPRVARDQQAGRRPRRAHAPGHAEPGLSAGPILTLHRGPRREVHVLVHQAPSCRDRPRRGCDSELARGERLRPMSEKGGESRLGPHLWDAVPGKWNADGDEVLVCCHVRSETHDVKSFLFRTRSPSLFRYRPGQFITLELEIDGEAINRCYTLSSTPTRPDTISITVKRVPGGKVSNWLHDNMKPGMEIKALGPAGDFSCTLRPAAEVSLLSGGSGVTPLMSMSRAHYDLGEDGDIVFVHSARTPRDIIFRRELAAMTNGMGRFRTAFVCEQAGEERDWGAPTGYLSLMLLKSIVPDFAQREIFCCGPEPYMAAVRTMLKECRLRHGPLSRGELLVRAACSSVEGAATKPPPPDALAQGFKIEFTGSGALLNADPTSSFSTRQGQRGCAFPSHAARAFAAPARRRNSLAMSS